MECGVCSVKRGVLVARTVVLVRFGICAGLVNLFFFVGVCQCYISRVSVPLSAYFTVLHVHFV